MKAITHVSKSMYETYHIQKDGEWATICINGWHRPDGPSGRTNRTYCGEFLAYTSFGVFGYQWTAMGQPLKEFLLDVELDYFCQKAYAGETTVFDFDQSIKALRDKVLAVRKEQGIDREEARALYEAIDNVDYSQDATEFVSACMSADIRDYAGSKCDFDEPWEFVRRVPNPQCVGFWKTIWPLFCNQLRVDLEDAKPKCACCGTKENLHRDLGSGGPYRCNSPDCMVF